MASEATYRVGIWARSTLAVLAYLGRVVIFGFNPSLPEAALASDIVVFAIAAWAMIPGRREFGPDFGRRFHWTGLFAAIPLLALLLGIRDVALLAAAWGH